MSISEMTATHLEMGVKPTAKTWYISNPSSGLWLVCHSPKLSVILGDLCMTHFKDIHVLDAVKDKNF